MIAGEVKGLMETRAQRRRRFRLMRASWPTYYKFLEDCGCGFNIDATDIDTAMQVLSADYVAHNHNRGQSTISGKLLRKPGLQIGTISMDFVQGQSEFKPGGPYTPCPSGTGWDFACYGCGKEGHADRLPIEHPETYVEGGGDNVVVCDDCFQKLSRLTQ